MEKNNIYTIKKSVDFVRLLEFYKSLNNLYLGEQTVKDSKELLSGNIRIGVPTYIANSYLVDKIDRFHSKYPNIKFYIQNRSTIDMIYMLEKHQLDFIIDIFPIKKNGLDIINKKLISLETAFVGEAGFVKKYNIDNIKKEDICNVPLILPNENTVLRKKIDQEFEKYDIKLNPIMEISTTEMLLKILRKNIGIGYLITDTVTEKLEKNRMNKINIDIDMPKIDIGIAYINNFITYAPKRFIEEELI